MQIGEPIGMMITTFERPELTVKCFKDIIGDPRISSVGIVDDHSSEESFNLLQELIIKEIPELHKVFYYRNEENIGMSRNKAKAIRLSLSEWTIIGDSDNCFDSSYLDALAAVGELQPDTIYCPSQARPNFIFEKFAGRTFDRHSIKELAADAMGNCSLNCCNYVVPKKAYGEVYKHNPEMKATDTVYFSYLWLKAGYKFHIVKDMGYFHLNHPGSGFLQDVDYNMRQAEKVRQLILSL